MIVVGGRAPDESMLQRVVKLGPCSAVLVSESVLVTSAHCLAFPVREIRAKGDVIPIASCTRHPEYVEGHVAHDIGTCRLERSASVGAMPLEDAALRPTMPVSMAGYGRMSVVDVGAPVLRQVDTWITGVREDSYLVGTSDRTACSGDSGGPVFAAHEGDLRLAAIVSGTTGALCASSAEAVPIAPHRAWIEAVVGQRSERLATWTGYVVGGLSALLLSAFLLQSVTRPRTK